MSESRNDILDGIRQASGRKALNGSQRAPLEKRLDSHPRNLIPARSNGTPAEQVELFVSMAEYAATTVARVPSEADVPAAAQDFLRTHNLPAKLTISPDSALDGIDWGTGSVLQIDRGLPDANETLSGVTGALAGIAETGTLMLTSGDDRPTTLNFLPDNHLVVLRASQVVGPYEDAWDRLRAVTGNDLVPRTVNLITGPSRTGDIEQRIQLGAHGPRRLHIILIEDGEA